MHTQNRSALVAPMKRRTYLAIAWLIGFCLFFYSFTLPNDPQGTSRALLWQAFLTPGESFLPFHLLDRLVDPPNRPADPPAGWSYFGQRLDLLLVAAVILSGAWALGRLALRVVRPQNFLHLAEQTAFTFGLGLSALSLVTLGFGLLGWLTQVLMLEFLAACIFAEILLWLRDRRKTQTNTNRQSADDSGDVPRWPWLVVAPFLLAMLLGAMLPSTDFDVKEYHLQGPKEFFLNGHISFLEHNIYTSFPFLTEMLTLLAMVLRGDWFRGALAGKAVLMSFAPLTALAVYAAGRRWFGPTVGWLAAVIYLTTPWTYRISIIAYVEGGLSFYLFSTLLAVTLGVEQLSKGTAPLRTFLLAGLLAGSVMACKYPGVLQVVIPMGAVVAVTPCVLKNVEEPVRLAFRSLGWFTLGVVCTIGPWLLKNTIETGNPVYPLLYSIFDGRDLNAELAANWREGHRPDDHSLKDLGVKVIDVTAKSDWLSPLLFGLAPLAFLSSEKRRLIAWLWAYVVFLFLAWWVFTHRIDRFWVPMVPVVALLAAIGAAWNNSRLWKVSCGTVFAAAVLFNLGFITTRFCGNNGYLFDLNFARSAAETTSVGIAYLNRHLPPNSKVLCVGEAQVFDARFPLVYNTVFDRSIFEDWFSAELQGVPASEQPMRPLQDIRETLKKHQITHVYVNWGEILRYRSPGSYGYTDFVTPARFEKLVEKGLLGKPTVVTWPDGRAAYGNYATLSQGDQAELDRWGAALMREYEGEPVFVLAEVYRVR